MNTPFKLLAAGSIPARLTILSKGIGVKSNPFYFIKVLFTNIGKIPG